jgi:hypothetical protein
MTTNESNEKDNFNITNEVQSIKDKLLILQGGYMEIVKEIETKNFEFARADEIAAKLLELKEEELVRINIAGKQAQTYLSNLLHLKDSLFYKLIIHDYINTESIRDEFYFDRSSEFFDILLNYIRTGIVIYEDLNGIEKNNLLTDFEFYGFWDAVKLLKSKISIKVINVTTSLLHSNYKATADFKLLHIKGNSSGYGTSTTNSWILFAFECESIVSKIEIAALSYNKPSTFATNQGKDSIIQTSLDGTTFVEVGRIPDNYSTTPIVIKLKKSRARYLKFIHTSYIGIGYLVIT